jgi:hypothetical protein
MVYVMDAQYCASGPELIKRRNLLFTFSDSIARLGKGFR